jgi:predicted Na+-dependent transporter
MQADFFTNILLPVGLGVLMLGMGLGLIPADFQRITRYPKAVLIGLVNQIIILPIVGSFASPARNCRRFNDCRHLPRRSFLQCFNLFS